MRAWVDKYKHTPITAWKDCPRPDWMLWLLMQTSRNYTKYRKRIAHAALDIYLKELRKLRQILGNKYFPGMNILSRLNEGYQVTLPQIERVVKRTSKMLGYTHIYVHFLMLSGLRRVVEDPKGKGWKLITLGLENLIDHKEFLTAKYKTHLQDYANDIYEKFKRPSDFAIKRSAGV